MNNQYKQTHTQLKEGMKVFDVNAEEVGTVEYVHFGDTTELNGADSLIHKIAESLTTPDHLPDEVRSRLQQEGYIKVDTSLFKSSRLASMDQVARVGDHEIHLTVAKEELVQV